ncbi:MAG: saccharopine dehydrogenase NADP-binding domain-containing protein [Gammaproteobacteria bacterium]|nr:saccharopine dehydrogenase NADP-binding domain-containing protein [Gammaproteobacteria bacterium]MCH9716294.1 saccharopine dehydrogenase NADP-binding domain-containing protein [Gammaproteobacteria bacterium]MCH9763836.1 saccharopine dehydrogenase NADP-binding domain-containing protein [Gammaproteobacteria bacterium]
MIPVMVAGAGKIGRLISCLLADTKTYDVYLADCDFSAPDTQQLLKKMPALKSLTLDMKDGQVIEAALKKHQISALISSLPYFLNPVVAAAVKAASAHYFDLTEDIAVAETIKKLAAGASTVFVPQCGMAPGFVSMVAHSLMQTFDSCHEVKLRVGALPQQTSNALHYSLTWSTDGLINECGEACAGIEGGKPVMFPALEGLESIQIEGKKYEAFYTSGGLGGLGTLYVGKIDRLTYKTIRYPGHCEKMRFLMQTLRLNEDRDTLKKILERAIPQTTQDMVLIYVSVEGIKNGILTEESYVKKIYPEVICGIKWSAIQVSTASAVCAVLEQVLDEKNKKNKLSGLVLQENFCLDAILSNRFGRFYT